MKTKTGDTYHAVSGIKYHEDIPRFWWKLRADGSCYTGEGVWVRPDDTMYSDKEITGQTTTYYR
jgi:hypothetical protein